MQVDQGRSSERALRTLLAVIVVGLLALALYAGQFWGAAQFTGIIAAGLLLAGAAVVTGGLLGFLFGIPRALRNDRSAPGPGATGAPSEAADRQPNRRDVEYQANTNLEDISDWLTKILVGVGLTQIQALPSGAQRLGEAVAPLLGDVPSSPAFAVALCVYYAVCGFLLGYLWTRLYLPGAFRWADLAARVEAVSQQVDEVKSQLQRDADALAATLRQLNTGPGTPPVPLERLTALMREASDATKIQIFNQARAARSENWQHNSAVMERAIPIFRALIADDTQNRFHRNHAQLAYALKDKQPPEWEEAERELTTAIQIRDQRRDGDWPFYEFNRAVCRIALGADQGAILDDLHIAARYDDVKQVIRDEEITSRWLDATGNRAKVLG